MTLRRGRGARCRRSGWRDPCGRSAAAARRSGPARLGGHEDPGQDVGEDAGAAEEQHHRRDPDDHRVDVEVLGHPGAHAGDVTVVGTAPQPARPRSALGGRGRRGCAGRAEVGGGIHAPSIGWRRARSQSGITLTRSVAARSRPGAPDAHPATARGIIDAMAPWPPPATPTSACSACRRPRPLGRRPRGRGRGRWRRALPGRRPHRRPPRAGRAHVRQRPRRGPLPGGLGAAARTRTPARRRRPAARRPSSGPSASACSPSGGAPVRPGRALLPAAVVWAVVLSAIGFGLVWSTPTRATAAAASCGAPAAAGCSSWSGLGILFASGGVLSTIGGLGLAVLATGVGCRAAARAMDPAVVAGPRGGAAPAHPLRGAIRDRRAPARLGAADAGPHPTGRRPRPGPHARPPSGARAARLAVRRAAARRRWRGRDAERRARAGRHRRRGSSRRRGRPRPGGRLSDRRRASTPSSPRSGRQPTTPLATPSVPEVSLYVEVEPHRVTGFVRDRGNGFASTRSSPAASACGSRSSAAWRGTAAEPRCTPRRARAPR